MVQREKQRQRVIDDWDWSSDDKEDKIEDYSEDHEDYIDLIQREVTWKEQRDTASLMYIYYITNVWM